MMVGYVHDSTTLWGITTLLFFCFRDFIGVVGLAGKICAIAASGRMQYDYNKQKPDQQAALWNGSIDEVSQQPRQQSTD
jgi:hypothetical protein